MTPPPPRPPPPPQPPPQPNQALQVGDTKRPKAPYRVEDTCVHPDRLRLPFRVALVAWAHGDPVKIECVWAVLVHGLSSHAAAAHVSRVCPQDRAAKLTPKTVYRAVRSFEFTCRCVCTRLNLGPQDLVDTAAADHDDDHDADGADHDDADGAGGDRRHARQDTGDEALP